MARKEKKVEQEKDNVTPASEVAVEKTSEPVESSKRTSVAVYRGGDLVREYSLDVHGEGFEKLAVEFACKRHGYELR